ENLLTQHPREAEILWGLALVRYHENGGRNPGAGLGSPKALEQARDLLVSLTTLKPGFVLAHWELPEVSRALGNADAALRAYQEVLRLDGSYKQAYPRIARLLALKKQYPQALLKFEQSMAMDPGNKKLRVEAKRVRAEAPKVSAQRKKNRMKRWEEWAVPEAR